jgi:hypothetical protein
MGASLIILHALQRSWCRVQTPGCGICAMHRTDAGEKRNTLMKKVRKLEDEAQSLRRIMMILCFLWSGPPWLVERPRVD